MAKRNWPEHTAVGLSIGVRFSGEPVECTIVDAKCGPMTVDTATFERPEADIRGSIILRVKLPGGGERWLPPIDGEQLCKWADAKRAEAPEVPR